jgi:hypothetical protein
MRSLLRSIFELANDCPAPERADGAQWHSRKEPDEKWRSIMAKYRSPLSEATTAPCRDKAVLGDGYGDWRDHIDAQVRGLARSLRSGQNR